MPEGAGWKLIETTPPAGYARGDEQGYTIRTDRQHWTIKAPGMQRPARFDKLGAGYTQTEIISQLSDKHFSVAKFIEARTAQPKPAKRRRYSGRRKRPIVKLRGVRAAYFRYLYMLGVLPKKRQQRQGRAMYYSREDVAKLESYLKQMEYLRNSGIETEVELRQRIDALDGVRGKWVYGPVFEIDPAELARFNEEFSYEPR